VSPAQQIRLESLKLAYRPDQGVDQIVARAAAFERFVAGEPDKGLAKRRATTAGEPDKGLAATS